MRGLVPRHEAQPVRPLPRHARRDRRSCAPTTSQCSARRGGDRSGRDRGRPCCGERRPASCPPARPGIGSCRLALCVAEDSHASPTPASSRGQPIATSFPRITRDWLARRGVEAHFVELSGSVEIMVPARAWPTRSSTSWRPAPRSRPTGSASSTRSAATRPCSCRTARVARPRDGRPDRPPARGHRDRPERGRSSNTTSRGPGSADAEKITPGFNSPSGQCASRIAAWCAVRADGAARRGPRDHGAAGGGRRVGDHRDRHRTAAVGQASACSVQ